jgi:drug/metabolite transporter (DMT)-like permease
LPESTHIAQTDAETSHLSAHNDRWKVLLALLIVYTVWGSTYIAIRFALVGVPPLTVGGIRFLIAGGLQLALFKALGAKMPAKGEWRSVAVIGFLLFGLGNGGVVIAEKYVSSGMTATGVATMPLWAAVISGLWGRWPGRLEWLGIGIGFAGIVLLNWDKSLQANPQGALALLVSVTGWSLGSIYTRYAKLPAWQVAAAAEAICGGVVMVAAGFVSGERMTAMPGPGVFWATAYLIVMGSWIGFTAYNYLLHHVRPALATSYAYVNPIVAVALGVLLAGEHVSHIQMVALGVIVAGVALVVLFKEKKETA